MFKKLKIGTKILIILSFVATMAVGIDGYIEYYTARSSLEEESFNNLTAIREMKANQIEDYFQQIINQIRTFSEDRMIINAMIGFNFGFKKIDAEMSVTDAEMSKIDLEVRNYYKKKFLDRLIPNLDRDEAKWATMAYAQYLPKNKNAKILQYLYITSNPHLVGNKHF